MTRARDHLASRILISVISVSDSSGMRFRSVRSNTYSYSTCTPENSGCGCMRLGRVEVLSFSLRHDSGQVREKTPLVHGGRVAVELLAFFRPCFGPGVVLFALMSLSCPITR